MPFAAMNASSRPAKGRRPPLDKSGLEAGKRRTAWCRVGGQHGDRAQEQAPDELCRQAGGVEDHNVSLSAQIARNGTLLGPAKRLLQVCKMACRLGQMARIEKRLPLQKSAETGPIIGHVAVGRILSRFEARRLRGRAQ